jgi:hypothetical protein
MVSKENALLLVVGALVVGIVLYWRAEAAKNAAGHRRAHVMTREECEAQTFGLIGPKGIEQVPLKYVASAVTRRGFKFPPEAERVMVAKPFEDDPCHVDGSFAGRDAADAMVGDGWQFRGWRYASDEELAESRNRAKYGDPRH